MNRKVGCGKCANANAIGHLYQQDYVSASVVIQCLGQLVEIGNASSLGYFTELLFYADEKFEQEVGADRSKLDEVKRHIFAFEKIVYEGKIEFESLDRKILVEAGLRLDEYYAEYSDSSIQQPPSDELRRTKKQPVSSDPSCIIWIPRVSLGIRGSSNYS